MTSSESSEYPNSVNCGDGESLVDTLVRTAGYDMISPSHYKDLGISPLEYIEANKHLTWSLSNAIKYISRAGLKPGNTRLQDLQKAQWYLEHEIEIEASA